MKIKGKFWIVYWVDAKGYTEFVELWTTEHLASEAAEKYQASHEGKIKFYYDYIELIK